MRIFYRYFLAVAFLAVAATSGMLAAVATGDIGLKNIHVFARLVLGALIGFFVGNLPGMYWLAIRPQGRMAVRVLLNFIAGFIIVAAFFNGLAALAKLDLGKRTGTRVSDVLQRSSQDKCSQQTILAP